MQTPTGIRAMATVCGTGHANPASSQHTSPNPEQEPGLSHSQSRHTHISLNTADHSLQKDFFRHPPVTDGHPVPTLPCVL